ncbi:probable LRR receptor-like serine threonine-kinase IRK [Olea europaea subsp. europaea]|uniref:Probable LRR receptor-like serine threonine-kinase IRK n=1 Tax=Olea europaea subsp. europaea TaxID=158383 RepID=A0A8S0RBT9_OLEEU|nr:probable LRR receptor-like serine threonine-kinase IRK [Olea europaea subsp. europaea]
MLLKILSVLFLAPFLVKSLDSALNDDVLGLIVFKAGLIDPQSRLISWNEEADTACNWVGVKCDSNSNRVTELVLNGFSLSGHLGRSLIRLQSLRVLSLSKNNFTGPINPILAQIENLEVLDLSENNLSGPLPDELFRQCRSLQAVSLAKNNLTGLIPQSLTSCSMLERVNFSSNQLSGQVPSELWSLRLLRWLDLSDNLLEGEIPRGIEGLYDLRSINLRRNRFIGWLPENIGNCLHLKSVDFGENYLNGGLPESMRKLVFCRYLDLSGNSLRGEFPNWIGDMRSLEFLDVSANNFSGQIPNSIGSLQSLKELNLSKNQFMGSLPESFMNCINLKVLDVGQNFFTGNLPSWVFKLALETVSASENRFYGNLEYLNLLLPSVSYQNLQVLDLSSNALSGGIPSAIGNFSRLRILNISRNSLGGFIPPSVGDLNTTLILDLSHNQLNGSIPAEIRRAVLLQELRLDSNFLTGAIPADIGNCSSLTSLILSHNKLTGPVPVAIASLSNLEVVDLSFNQLSESLPKELANLSNLVTFNVSYNHMKGELPVGGFFNTISPSSVIGNPSLCGSVVKHSCPAVHPKPLVLNPNSSNSNRGSLSSNLRHKRIILSISSLIAIGAAVFIAIGVVTVTILNMHVRASMARSAAAFTFSGGDDFSPSHGTEANYGKLVMFSGDADFIAGDQALLNKNCELGRGGFGAVYQTELRDGQSVAIKKLNTTSLVKSQEDFEREVKKLGRIRHQNLVALEGYYWTPSLQLLINEYIGGGSLYKHLHEGECNGCLTWQQRFKIILGTAKGLAHLHQMNIIHYNMKSTNVLINTCCDPKVGDFALAKLLPALDRYILSSKIQSALGYMAPEFACQTVKITEKCDVYGFGILILEVLTGKKPVEYMEDDVVVLCDMMRGALDEGRIEECIDKKLHGNYPVEEAIPVVKLGLICASQVPSNRPDMDEVIKILELIQCPSESQEVLE